MEMSRIVSIAKLALFALPVVLILVGAMLLSKTPDKKDRTFGQALKRCWIFALVLAVAYAGCFAVVRNQQSLLEGNVTISLNYPKASKGLNPNGTRFNTYDILSDAVLEAAIRDGNLGDLTPRQLRASLCVEPLEAGQASAEQYYVSTEYVLSYSATEDTQHLTGEEVVLAVANAYSGSFNQKYTRNSTVMELDLNRVDQLDYLDQVELLDKYAQDMAEYLEMCADEGKTYTAPDGETFSSLAAKVESLSKVELERLNAYILVKGLSRNPDLQLSRLSYLNLIKDIKADKNTASYGIHLEAVQMYERDLATIVLVPTRDDDGEFYMSRTKIGVDVFAEQAEGYSVDASRARTEISENNYAISQLSGSVAGEADYAAADAMVDSICASLDAFAEKGLEMMAEFDTRTTGEHLTLTLSQYDPMSKGNLMKYAILLAMMSVSGTVFLGALSCRKRGRSK